MKTPKRKLPTVPYSYKKFPIVCHRQARFDAKTIGIVDQVVQPLGDGLGPAAQSTHKYLEEVAVNAARELASGKLKINRDKGFVHKATQAVMTNSLFLDNVVLKMAKDKVMKMSAGNYPAPLRILDVVRTAYVDPKKGYEAEAKAFGELSQTFQSKALIGLFDGSTDAKKNKYGQGQPVNEIAVVGAGLMGAGIANVTIDKGVRTVLLDALRSRQARLFDGKVRGSLRIGAVHPVPAAQGSCEERKEVLQLNSSRLK